MPMPYSPPQSSHAQTFDVIIVGAGASGLYCAMTAGKRGRSVLVLDHANKVGKKVLMSGGGRCNFTNYMVEADHFIGQNDHFCKSALPRHPNWEFIALVDKHGIDYEEREHGQLFCQHSAKEIVQMLMAECEAVGVQIRLNTEVSSIISFDSITALNKLADSITKPATNELSINETSAKERSPNFQLATQLTAKKQSQTSDQQPYVLQCQSLVIATGGLSIPTMGASGFGYQVARQFGHDVVTTEASLVPFTFTGDLGEMIASLSGLSLDVVAFNDRILFALPMLFTHRGLSGPAMLQLSNYWQVGESININLLPTVEVAELLIHRKKSHPKQKLRTVLGEWLPKKLVSAWQAMYWTDVAETELANIKDDRLQSIGNRLNHWTLTPSGTEGYRTAEVTRGGVSTEAVSSKTMQSQLQPNLYFIGEVLDVTGWLGGYNFQWAWSSGWACGQEV